MFSRYPGLRHLLLAVALAGVALSARGGASLYKWVDADGVTHYSDVPVSGAAKVDVGAAQGYSSPSASGSGAQPPRRNAPRPTPVYTSVAITSPEEGTVIFGTDARLSISAAVAPGLANGHHLWFVLDGVRQPEPADGLSTDVEVQRGTHTVSATITDAGGTELFSGPAVTFYVRQHSIANPPRGPALPKTTPHS